MEKIREALTKVGNGEAIAKVATEMDINKTELSILNKYRNLIIVNDSIVNGNINNCDSCSKIAELQTELETEQSTIRIADDCKNCKEDNRKELITALLEINDLRQQVEELRARDSEIEVSRQVLPPMLKNC